ncbi:MAG TPA: hypothetical protein VHK47_02800 [Polyangia bacterium]|jgi:hypothetical protein|nr:hypothetical protein [Polyangia bacterium]
MTGSGHSDDDDDDDDALPPRCPASLRPGRPGRFGRVICPSCGARLKPLTGARLPVHRGAPRKDPTAPPE